MIDSVNRTEDLTREEQMVQETARDFVDNEVSPDSGEHWIEGTHVIHSLVIGHDLVGILAFE